MNDADATTEAKYTTLTASEIIEADVNTLTDFGEAGGDYPDAPFDHLIVGYDSKRTDRTMEVRVTDLAPKRTHGHFGNLHGWDDENDRPIQMRVAPGGGKVVSYRRSASLGPIAYLKIPGYDAPERHTYRVSVAVEAGRYTSSMSPEEVVGYARESGSSTGQRMVGITGRVDPENVEYYGTRPSRPGSESEVHRVIFRDSHELVAADADEAKRRVRSIMPSYWTEEETEEAAMGGEQLAPAILHEFEAERVETDGGVDMDLE